MPSTTTRPGGVAHRAGWPTRSSMTEAPRARCRCCPPLCSKRGRSRRSSPALTLAAYRKSGGVHGAVARLAEGTYARVPDERRQLHARAVMLRLVGEDEGDAPVRRCARSPSSIWSATRTWPTCSRRWPTAVSLPCRKETEVAHEALLLMATPTRVDRRRHRRAPPAPPHHSGVTEWDAAGRDQGELYRGARLAAASAGRDTRSTSTSSSASSSPRAARHPRRRRHASGEPTAACAACLPGSRSCWRRPPGGLRRHPAQ